MTAGKSQTLTEHLFRREYAKLVSLLTSRFGTSHLEGIEEAVQEAFVEAMRVWEFRGIPENAAGWLYTVARNKTLNILRHERQSMPAVDELDSIATTKAETAFESFNKENIADEIQDSLLRMMFVCCDPRLTEESQVALILKTLCGFGIAEIASAFLTNEATIQKRLVRARKKLRDARISMELPATEELPARLYGVLTAVYLLFNAGYKTTATNASRDTATPEKDVRLIRREVCFEAVGLLEILLQSDLFVDDPGVHACYALLLFNTARFDARQDAEGEILRMADQDRAKWNRQLITRGVTHLEQASAGGLATEYHIQAAISAYHCAAPDYASTDWPAILALYDAWLEQESSPIIYLNRAIASSRVHGPTRAIQELEDMADEPAFHNYYLFDSTLGELNFEAGNIARAIEYYQSALELGGLPAEQRLLQQRIDQCRRVLAEELPEV